MASFLRSHLTVLLSSGCRVGISHLTVQVLLQGRPGRARSVTFLLLAFPQTLWVEVFSIPMCYLGVVCAEPHQELIEFIF